MSATPAFSAESGATASDAAAASDSTLKSSSPASVSLPEVGQVWRGIYQVRQLLSDSSSLRAWKALRTDTIEDVVLRVATAAPGSRRAAVWEALEKVEHPSLVRAQTAFGTGSQRIEVCAAPEGESLADWKQRGAADIGMVERLIRPVGEALALLHRRGIAHLGVRMQNIFVREEHGALSFVLGGLETAELIDQSGLIPVKVDPFNAPPEAAGLFQHSPGAGLCAWDWWSLGRVVQELILGRHIVGHILQRDVSRITPELTAHAEALLLEREAGGFRAGGVEAMPTMDKRLDLLLRGLLTSSRDARWDYENITAWLRREPVRDSYQLSRNERLFRWRNHAYTVPDIAGKFRAAENWSEALEHVWEPQKAGTLAHFLGESLSHRPLREKQDELRKLADSIALKSFPPPVVREVLTAVALLELAGEKLVWRGLNFDEKGLLKIFAGSGDDIDRLALLRAFIARPVLVLIERVDPAASRALADLGQQFTSAESLLRVYRWFKEAPPADQQRLLRPTLTPLPELAAEWKKMQEGFACSTDPALEKIFKSVQPTRPELIALAWIGENPAERGFLTHAQWAEREHTRLVAAARRQVTALIWLRLVRALGFCPLVFGPWRIVAVGWTLLAVGLAIVFPGPLWLALAFTPALLATGLRLGAWLHLKRELAQAQPDAAPWTWKDGATRCRAELGSFGTGATRLGVERSLAALNQDILKLRAHLPALSPVSDGPRFGAVWALALTGWLVFFAFAGTAAWRVKLHRPTVKDFLLAWNPPKPVPPPPVVAPGETAPAPAPVVVAPEPEEPTGPVKVSWPFKPGDDAQVLLVIDSVEARPEQLRSIAERGPKLMDPYKPETVNTLVIFQVPMKEKFGVMIYNGQKRQLENLRVYVLNFPPIPRSWVEVAGRKGIYIPD